MLVSVAMPLYNKARYVARALASVRAQQAHGAQVEIVVVDDGSTDGSAQVVESLGLPGLRLVRQANAGEGPARDRAAREAAGEVIAFLDPDDEWLPGFLAAGLALIADCPTAGAAGLGIAEAPGEAGGGEDRFDPRGKPARRGLVGDWFAEGFAERMLTSSSALVPRRVFEAVSPVVSNARIGADIVLWSQIALRFPIAYDSAVHALYHVEAAGRSLAVYEDAGPLPFVTLLEDALAHGLPEGIREASVRDFIARHQLLAARRMIRGGGDRALARQVLWRYRPAPGDRGRWLRYLLKTFAPSSRRA